MDAIFGMELPLLVKFVVSFAFVLLLIGAAALLVRKFGGKALIPGATPRGRQPRLAIVDITPVDSRRSLVIVRRDNVEHLLLIGGPTDVLVEANISSAAVQPAREPEPEIRVAVVEPAAIVPPPVAAAVPSPVIEVPVPSEPDIVPDPRVDVRAEPVLMPEPRPDPEVRIPPIPAFAPLPPPPAAARAEVFTAEVFAEPYQPHVPPAVAPPPLAAVPPLPVAATAAPPMDDPLARFARDLDAHRDQMNGPAKSPPPAVQVPPVPAVAAVSPVRPVEPTFSEDQSLADMAQRLEAALRRPLGANGARPVPQQPQPAPRVSATVSVRQAESLRRAPVVAPPTPAQRSAAPSLAPPVVAVPSPAPDADRTEVAYENLQREMASLLGRKPGSS